MEKHSTLHFISYDRLLRAANLTFREEGNLLTVGKPEVGWGYGLFVSCKTIATTELIRLILPLLKDSGTAFQLVKNQLVQYRMNAGAFGEDEVGKVFRIFPPDTGTATCLLDNINRLTVHLRGPVIGQAQRLGNLTYLQRVDRVNGLIRGSLPSKDSLPVPVPKAFRIKKTRKFISARYLRVDTIRSNYKGGIYKAINLAKLSFTWCLVKEGKPAALDDHFDRDMRHRLSWQKQVAGQLADVMLTPRCIDYFERGEMTYLVMDFAEGTLLGQAVTDLMCGSSWKTLSPFSRSLLLTWFSQAVQLVSEVHRHGFIHRDITDGNFIVLPDGRLCILDFELAYHREKNEPDPPFLLGTFGYASPEQLRLQPPTLADDIYSLGALLTFVISGIHPTDFIGEHLPALRKKVYGLTGDKTLTNLAMDCLAADPSLRPGTDAIKQRITMLLTINKYDPKTLAIGND